MSQSQDAYRKVGRGGAGNFYSAKAAEDNGVKDLEAQNLNPVADDTTNTAVSNTASNVQGQYARAGRGGAGNFFDPSTAREQQKEEDQAAASVKPAVQQSGAGRMALGGRGGAGNYHQKPQEDDHEKEGGKLKEVERKVMEHVEGLAKPPKALLAHERR